MFGTELTVMPITSPADKVTGMGSADCWLPQGEWFDFFGGMRYSGGRTIRVYRDLCSMPVFAKAGAVIPMSGIESGVAAPKELFIDVFPGADGEFSLYEDDNGESVTRMRYDMHGVLTIEKPTGKAVSGRTYKVRFRAVKNTEVSVTGCGEEIPYTAAYDGGVLTVSVKADAGDIVMKLIGGAVIKENDIAGEVRKRLMAAQCENGLKQRLYTIVKNGGGTSEMIAAGAPLEIIGAISEVTDAFTAK